MIDPKKANCTGQKKPVAPVLKEREQLGLGKALALLFQTQSSWHDMVCSLQGFAFDLMVGDLAPDAYQIANDSHRIGGRAIPGILRLQSVQI
eukprot:5880122-Amphidinium_carterae.2